MNSPEKEKREQETYESFFAGSDQQKSPLRLDFDYHEWEIFRREVAKDVLSGLASWNTDHYVTDDVKLAISYADELIKQLKEESK